MAAMMVIGIIRRDLIISLRPRNLLKVTVQITVRRTARTTYLGVIRRNLKFSILNITIGIIPRNLPNIIVQKPPLPRVRIMNLGVIRWNLKVSMQKNHPVSIMNTTINIIPRNLRIMSTHQATLL
jgi:hypothetical protein